MMKVAEMAEIAVPIPLWLPETKIVSLLYSCKVLSLDLTIQTVTDNVCCEANESR